MGGGAGQVRGDADVSWSRFGGQVGLCIEEGFERFRVEDKDMLSLFARHIQPNWKIPTYQHILDWISGSTFLIALAYLLFHTGKRLFFKKT